MNNKFILEISSDLDYEEMIAIISYENHTIATISQENGVDFMEVEIHSPKEYHRDTWKFSLDEFLKRLVFCEKNINTNAKIT